MKTFGFSLINPAPAVSATPPATNLVVYRQHRAVDVFSHVLVAYAALSTKRVRGAVAVCFATSRLVAWRRQHRGWCDAADFYQHCKTFFHPMTVNTSETFRFG